ncbi:15910_t:CDS:10, partial [Acaulospora colombiana]
PLSDSKSPVSSEKLSKPKVTENIKKIKERIIQTNQLLQLFKTKEKELAQHKECIASLEQKLSKMKTQTASLNKENEVFRQAAQQFRSEFDKIKKELGQKEVQLKEQATLTNELKRLRIENEKLGKKNKSLEVLKSQLECKVQENEAAMDLQENQTKEIARLKKELERKEQQYKQSQSEKASAYFKLKKLQKDTEKSKEALCNRISTLEMSSLEKDTIIESLNQQLEELRRQETNVEDMKQEIIRLTIIEKSHADNLKELEELKKQIKQTKVVNTRINKELLEQSREMSRLKKRSDEFERFKKETQDLHLKINNVQELIHHENEKSVNVFAQRDKETSQHVIILIEEIQSMKYDVENLETQKKALQDLVTAQQVEISRLRKFRRSVSLSRVNEIERLYNKQSESSPQDQYLNISPDCDSSMQFLATSPLELIGSRVDVQPSTSEKDVIDDRSNVNKLKRRKSIDARTDNCPTRNVKSTTIITLEDTMKPTKRNPGRKRKDPEVTSPALNVLSAGSEQPKKRRISKKTETVLKNKVFFDHIDDSTFIKEKISEFGTSSQEAFRSMDVLQQFAFEKSAVFLQAIDELIRDIDTPAYLESNSKDDALRNFSRKGTFLVQMPAVLPQKEIDILLFLLFLLNEFPTNSLLEKIIPWVNDKFILFGNNFDDLADLTYCCLPSQVPPLEEILQSLVDILQSEEFHNRCSNEYHQEKFREYCFNLTKSFELATCWLKWDEVFDKFIGKILWPLVKDEKGRDIPLEIIGAICRPRLTEHEDKMGVDEIRRRTTRLTRSLTF